MERLTNPKLQRVIRFLREIGLDVQVVEGARGFVDGVQIVAGGLHVAPNCSPSVALHEAGHCAIVPDRFRPYLHGNLVDGLQRMFKEMQGIVLPPDHPLDRAVGQCGDKEATAWAYAAGLAVGLDPADIILDSEYEGSGDEIRMMLSMSQYAGINGLAFAGMCKRGRHVVPEERYPAMQCWLQSADV